jgi:hypothetical protein
MVVIILGEMALLSLIIQVVAARLQERARWRFELQARLLDRFSSPAELQQFLESEGGQRLLLTLSPRQAPLMRVLLTIQAGIVLLVVGAGLVVVAEMAGGTPDRDVLTAGEIVGALGLGLLIAAAVARRLSRAWGLAAEASAGLESETRD